MEAASEAEDYEKVSEMPFLCLSEVDCFNWLYLGPGAIRCH